MTLDDVKQIVSPTQQEKKDIDFMNLCTCECGRMNEKAVAILSFQSDELEVAGKEISSLFKQLVEIQKTLLERNKE